MSGRIGRQHFEFGRHCRWNICRTSRRFGVHIVTPLDSQRNIVTIGDLHKSFGLGNGIGGQITASHVTVHKIPLAIVVVEDINESLKDSHNITENALAFRFDVVQCNHERLDVSILRNSLGEMSEKPARDILGFVGECFQNESRVDSDGNAVGLAVVVDVTEKVGLFETPAAVLYGGNAGFDQSYFFQVTILAVDPTVQCAVDRNAVVAG